MTIGITKGLTTWRFQDHYVERLMDNAAYTQAHPDDTLVLAGPARYLSATLSDITGPASLLAIGMLQTVNFTSQAPVTPLMMIGSGRLFFVRGKSQTRWQIGRLFVNGRNLLRILYHNAVAAGLPVQNFDDPAAFNDYTDQYYINLDSELYYIPFGLASIFRTKSHSLAGAFYAELNMIDTFSVGYNSGQNMILENVTGICDRLLPFYPVKAGASTGAIGEGAIPRSQMDSVLGFVDPNPTDGQGLEDDLTASVPETTF